MSDFDDELTIANKLLGVTVRRAPINYVGPKVEVQPESPKTKPVSMTKVKRVRVAKEPKPPKPQLTEEQIKKRKAERALHWYNERKNDEALKEKRRQYAKEYQAKKRDK